MGFLVVYFGGGGVAGFVFSVDFFLFDLGGVFFCVLGFCLVLDLGFFLFLYVWGFFFVLFIFFPSTHFFPQKYFS